MVKHAPAAKALGIMHFDDLSLYIVSEEGIFIMIRATNAFVEDEHSPVPFDVNPFHRHAGALLADPHACYLEQGQENFPSFAQFLDNKIQ